MSASKEAARPESIPKVEERAQVQQQQVFAESTTYTQCMQYIQYAEHAMSERSQSPIWY
jgi:hypothetical protein